MIETWTPHASTRLVKAWTPKCSTLQNAPLEIRSSAGDHAWTPDAPLEDLLLRYKDLPALHLYKTKHPSALLLMNYIIIITILTIT